MSLLRAVAGLMAASALALGCSTTEQVNCNCTEPPRGCVYTGRADCPCAAMVCSDIGPVIDLGNAVVDSGSDAGSDVPMDQGAMDTGSDVPMDRGVMDTGSDVPMDRGVPDVGIDVPMDRGVADVGIDAGSADVPSDRGVTDGSRVDVQGVDAPRNDAGLLMCAVAPGDRSCSTDSQCALGIYPQNCVGEQRAVAYNARAMAEFTALRACWTLLVAEMIRCSDRPSRGIEVEQTGMFVTDPTLIEASCRSGQCVARPH